MTQRLPPYLKYDPEKTGEEPLGYAVKCPPAHAYDHLVFPDVEAAEAQAADFAERGDAEAWEIIPLYAGPAKVVAAR